MSDLYVPADIDEAHEIWNANCGPIAAAAVLGQPVMVMRHIFGYDWPGFTNPTLMKKVMAGAGKTMKPSTEQAVRDGLGFVQFEGPWEKGGARAAYAHTHWVALARRPWLDTGRDVLMVFDAAVGERSGWVQIGAYSASIVPQYLAREPRSTGWRFRNVWAVE